MSLVTQYGVRLLKLRVTEAEIKTIIRWGLLKRLWLIIIFIVGPRLMPTGKNINIRVFISSDNTFTITTHMYREVEDLRTGEVSQDSVSGRPELKPRPPTLRWCLRRTVARSWVRCMG